jgi:hypothetical protein
MLCGVVSENCLTSDIILVFFCIIVMIESYFKKIVIKHQAKQNRILFKLENHPKKSKHVCFLQKQNQKSSTGKRVKMTCLRVKFTRMHVKATFNFQNARQSVF